MPLSRILPYAAMLLVGQAVIDAGPAIVAEREGGMGLGSALIGALVTQIAGIVLGATVAGHVVDRRSTAAAVLSGAFLYYVGLMVTGIAPMGALGSVMIGMGVAGIGFGFLLTAAFSATAAVNSPRDRAAAVVLLLAAPIAARVVVGSAFAAGPPAFLVGGGAIVGLAILAVRLHGVGVHALGASGSSEPAPMSAAPAALAAVVLACGAMLAFAGADPSRLSASLIAGALGMRGLDTIDLARAVMFVAGVALLAVGAVVQLIGADRTIRTAALGVLLLVGAGAGITAALTRALIAGRIPDGAPVLIGAATAVGGGLGLAIGGVLASRSRERRLPALIGSAVLTVVCLLGMVILVGERPEAGDVVPIALIGVAGVGVGLAASALRLVLTDVEPGQRGLAAGAGVVASVVAMATGSLIGAGEFLGTIDATPRGVPLGLVGFVVAAAGALAAAASLRGAPERGDGRVSDRLSQPPA